MQETEWRLCRGDITNTKTLWKWAEMAIQIVHQWTLLLSKYVSLLLFSFLVAEVVTKFQCNFSVLNSTFFVCLCFHASSELILKIEIQRKINLIHLAQELDPAAYRILLVTLRTAMPIQILIKISMILMIIIQHRMRALCLIQDRAHSAHPCKTWTMVVTILIGKCSHNDLVHRSATCPINRFSIM